MEEFWQEAIRQEGIGRARIEPDEGLEERWAEVLPRGYRGLPRLYKRDDPSCSRIKDEFCRLFHLRKCLSFKPLLQLYDDVCPKGKVAILTDVLADGLGDWAAAVASADILSSRFPNLGIELYFTHEKPIPPVPRYPVYSAEKFDPRWLKKIKQANVAFTIPTPFPIDLPHVIRIGEYGYLESGWFHPQSKNWSMGLHVLELGVMIAENKQSEIESEEIRTFLKPQNPIFFAYLATAFAGKVYLTALLHALRRDDRDIDLICPDCFWWFKWIETKSVPPFPGVQTIEMIWKGKNHRVRFQDTGKRVRIFVPEKISRSDVQTLYNLSEDFVGARGNQSWSEALATGKPFFYDSKANTRYFCKDLIALAKHRFLHPASIRYIELMEEAFVATLEADPSEWVEETHFQPRRGWKEIGEEMGELLFCQELASDFSRLSKIIRQEHSFNDTLPLIIKRAFLHRVDPELKKREETLWDLYAEGAIPFSLLVKQRRI